MFQVLFSTNPSKKHPTLLLSQLQSKWNHSLLHFCSLCPSTRHCLFEKLCLFAMVLAWNCPKATLNVTSWGLKSKPPPWALLTLFEKPEAAKAGRCVSSACQLSVCPGAAFLSLFVLPLCVGFGTCRSCFRERGNGFMLQLFVHLCLPAQIFAFPKWTEPLPALKWPALS